MAEELGRGEAAASTEMAAAASNKSSTDTLAAFDSFILVAKNSDSDLMASRGDSRMEKQEWLLTLVGSPGFSNLQGKCPGPLRDGQHTKAGMAGMPSLLHHEELPQHW
jgi:hypothetical protein